MTTFLASAPGKVVLCGEYAVLDGAPAICMAVNRRATARVTESPGDFHRVSAPGHSELEGRFVADGPILDWLQAGNEYTIVDSVWRALGLSEKSGLSIELDSRTFVDQASGTKIGIGSSAAMTVALAAALKQSCDVLASATRAHRDFQQGAGSGADIATSVSGGLIEYHMKDSKVAPRNWPDGLAYRLIWTGVPASTRSRLDKLEVAGHRNSRRKLARAAESVAQAWRDASSVMGELPVYIDALRQFSVDHDLGIFDAGHEQLVIESAAAGLVYKPCGAGGGDVGVLLGYSEEQLDEFIESRAASGCQVVPCRLELNGVELEQS